MNDGSCNTSKGGGVRGGFGSYAYNKEEREESIKPNNMKDCCVPSKNKSLASIAISLEKIVNMLDDKQYKNKKHNSTCCEC